MYVGIYCLYLLLDLALGNFVFHRWTGNPGDVVRTPERTLKFSNVIS